MTLRLRPYPRYRDSGLPWLGQIPEHWDLERAKWLFQKMDRPVRDSDEVVTCFRDGVVTLRKNRRTRGFTESLKEIGYQGIRKGDLVIHAMDAFAGAIGVSDADGKGTPVYSVCKPKPNINPYYYSFLIREMARSQWILALAKGIRERSTDFRFDAFAAQTLPWPPSSEQDTISQFLARVDQRIQRLIRAKRRLIELLKEQKQVMIHRAVTRGLDPDVPMKPSGIEWLAIMPKHWDRRSLGRCLRRIDQGWSPVAAEGKVSQDQWAVLTLSSVKQGTFNATAIKPIPFSAEVPTGIEIRNGDLLLTRSNTRDLVGDACLVRDARPRTIISDLIYRLIPNPGTLDSTFLMYQLLSPSCRRQIERDARGSSGTMPKIAQRHIRAWIVVLPPLEEQRRIARTVEESLGNIELARRQAETELSLLQEYRTRLIADVVTGKLDVREVELPELEEGLENLEAEEDETD